MMKCFLIKEEMIKKFKYLFIILILLNSCQSLKDGLEGKRNSSNSDEFLVEKKDPLVLPPEFDKLPEPGFENIKKQQQEKFTIENAIKKNKKKINTVSNSKKSISSVEKSILEKIKKN